MKAKTNKAPHTCYLDIIVNEILTNRVNLEQLNYDNVAKITKGEIIASARAHPNKTSTEVLESCDGDQGRDSKRVTPQ